MIILDYIPVLAECHPERDLVTERKRMRNRDLVRSKTWSDALGGCRQGVKSHRTMMSIGS